VAVGDLELAEERFLDATRADPAFGDAQFWLAQTRAWQDRALEAWAHAAERAIVAASNLADPEARALAPALLDLARGRFPEACRRYESALAADSTDYVAWLGLGQCHFQDATVVPDPASPSHWRFRGSYHMAAVAYRRGLAVAPFLSGAVISRLRRICCRAGTTDRARRTAPSRRTALVTIRWP
jgi:tetratricopeptide (TPR) repeat protein